MIKRFREEDIDNVMQIWLDANLQAHYFIPKCYWKGHYNMVRDMLPSSEVWVYELENVIFDKAVTIRSYGRLIGQRQYPIVIGKNVTL